MYIKRMTGPADGQTLQPTWDQVEAAIKALNAQDKSMVTIDAGDAVPHMCIGGGGQYIVYITYDNLTFFNLDDPSKGNAIRSLIAGGQLGEYAAHACMDLASALQAAKVFAETGKQDENLKWVRDG